MLRPAATKIDKSKLTVRMIAQAILLSANSNMNLFETQCSFAERKATMIGSQRSGRSNVEDAFMLGIEILVISRLSSTGSTLEF